MSIKSSNINRIGVLAVCLLSFIISCKKKQPHELTGEKAVFLGTWRWTYSSHTHNYCEGTGDITTDILTPLTEEHDFRIEFLEEGRVNYYQDGLKIIEQNTFFTAFQESVVCPYGGIQFGLKYSYEGSESKIFGCIWNDTIRTGFFEEFLFPYEPGCESYNNYFVKE